MSLAANESAVLGSGAPSPEDSGEFVAYPPQRATRAWSHWLDSMANDPEAALAAALGYQRQEPHIREQWLNAVAADMQGTKINPMAVLAPLLSVERDAARSRRIAELLQRDGWQIGGRGAARVLASELGVNEHGEPLRVLLVDSPLYLDFVKVLALGYVPHKRFVWVRHDPIACRGQLPTSGDSVMGVRVEAVPGQDLIDELAETVVAVSRGGEALPEPLRLFTELFSCSDYSMT